MHVPIYFLYGHAFITGTIVILSVPPSSPPCLLYSAPNALQYLLYTVLKSSHHLYLLFRIIKSYCSCKLILYVPACVRVIVVLFDL